MPSLGRAVAFAFRLGLALARVGMSADMAIGELDVESRTRLHFGGAAQHRAVGRPHQGEAARQHVVIAERLEQLCLAVELRPRAREQRGDRSFAGAIEADQPVRGRTCAARATIWGLSRAALRSNALRWARALASSARCSLPLAVSKRWRGRSRILALRGSPRASPANLWRSPVDPAPERGGHAQAVLRHGDQQIRRAPARRARRRRSASARGNRRRDR